MFMLNKKHYMAIVEGLIEKKLDVNMWVYARMDTVRPDILKNLRDAEIHWLCIGIESANERNRKNIGKVFKDGEIVSTVRKIREAGIYVLANYMFGLWEDDYQAMLETLILA